MVIPNLELLGMIGALGVASVAAWSSANLNMRVRLLERDIDELHDEVQVVRRRSSAQLQAGARDAAAPFAAAPFAAAPAWQPLAAQPQPQPQPLWEPTPAPVFQPLFAHYAGSAASQPRADWAAHDDAQPDVSELAAQLGSQSRHTMEFVLSPALDLGGAGVNPDAGAASEQQDPRLLRWAASVPSAS